tara:strand:+ start:4435 stop:4662 length:228 start_codon:yes stop_codon:yes gene_type:complete
MKEINFDDLLNMCGHNVYDTEYSIKLSISCRTSTHTLFKDIKRHLNDNLGMKVNNAQLFEFMVVEMYNSINNNKF